MAAVFLATSVAAVTSGVVAWWLVSTGRLGIPALLAPAISPAQHDGFTIAMWVHNTSYAAGALSAVLASAWLWMRRKSGGDAVPCEFNREVQRSLSG